MSDQVFLRIDDIVTNKGNSLLKLSQEKQVLLVFLRHLGCVFCREALFELATKRSLLEASHTQIVLVQMADAAAAKRLFKKFKLQDLEFVTDPDCEYYQRFGLIKAKPSQLFGLSTWAETFRAAILEGGGIHLPLGDGFQMPGVFLIRNGAIINSFIHKEVYDKPDYITFVRCCNDDQTHVQIQ
jgi:hypothetical protein